MAEQLRATNSGVSDQQSVGSNPQLGHLFPFKGTPCLGSDELVFKAFVTVFYKIHMVGKMS